MIYLVSAQTNVFDNQFKQISLEEAIKMIASFDEVQFDTETTGLDCILDKLLCMQFGFNDIQIVVDISSYGTLIPEILKKYMNNSNQTFILHNAKFDLKFLYVQDVWLQNVYDTMLVETILTIGLQESGRDLHTVCEKYCNVDLDKSERANIIKGLTTAGIHYAALDVVYLQQIKKRQMKQVDFLKMNQAVILDNNFVKALAYIEFCGIKLDWEKWKEKAKRDLQVVIEKKAQLDAWLLNNGYLKYFDGMQDLFGGGMKCTINWGSSKQVIALFESLGINCTTVVKGVKKKTVEEKVIGKFKKEFPILVPYFEYKGALKLSSTYGLSWEKMINPITGRIHTTFKQLMDTGRLSCGNMREGHPNLQNLPHDALTRSCFIPEKGNKFISVDYCAQESIVLVNDSLDKNLLLFYQKGFQDIHSYVTFLLFPEVRRCELDDLTNDELNYIKKNFKEKRNIAKTAEFAISYGGNGSTIAKNTGQSKAQGDFVYDSYFESFSDLKDYFDKGMRQVEKDHYILFNKITGRKYFFKESEPFIEHKDYINDITFTQNPEHRKIEGEYNKSRSEAQRKSQNFRIQGTAADISKLAVVILFNRIRKEGLLNKVKLCNFVHDEICAECPEDIANYISDMIVSSMEKAADQFCKIISLKAASEIGDCWIH